MTTSLSRGVVEVVTALAAAAAQAVFAREPH